MPIVDAKSINVLGGGQRPVTIFRDSFNRGAGGLGANWAGGSKVLTPFSNLAMVTTAWRIAAATVGTPCVGSNVLGWDHTAPTFNPAYSLPFWGIATPTANALVNGLSQFASARLCSTARAGNGNLDVGPAVFVDMGVEFGGSGYFMDITASSHAWSLQRSISGTFATLAAGAG